jgi:hypothetical protein
MDPGFSQLAVLWEREKTQSIAFGSSVVAPKRCTGHHFLFLNQPIDMDTKFTLQSRE